MAIPISTYTEPAQVYTHVKDLPQAQEPEEKEEPSDFAGILAGLLRNTESIQTDIPSIELSEIETDITELAGENLNLFGKETEDINLFEKDLSPIEIPDEHFSVMSAEQFVSLPESIVDIDTLDDLSAEIASAAVNHLETGAKIEPSITASTEEAPVNNDVSQIAGAFVKPKEVLHYDTGNKKDLSKERSAAKTENIEALSAKETKNEKIANPVSKPDNENPGRLDEMRSRSRRGLSFEIRDLRTGLEANGLNNSQMRSYSIVETATGRANVDSPVRDITLELRLPDNSGSVGQSQAQTTWEARAGSALENMLARELHQNFNGDIVRHASMALRDGGEGTIRIALKPENLGNVKIRLELSENKITGRIVVESIEALNAFRKELSSLEQAFRDSGFTNAELDLSLTTDGQNAQESGQETDSFTPRMIASLYDDSFEMDTMNMADVSVEQRLGSINMLA